MKSFREEVPFIIAALTKGRCVCGEYLAKGERIAE